MDIKRADRPKNLATAWRCWFFSCLIAVVLMASVKIDDTTIPLWGLFLGTWVTLAIMFAGWTWIWRWQRSHPPAIAWYRRTRPGGPWEYHDPVRGAALLLGCIPVGFYALPYYTIMGLREPFDRARDRRAYKAAVKAVG